MESREGNKPLFIVGLLFARWSNRLSIYILCPHSHPKMLVSHVYFTEHLWEIEAYEVNKVMHLLHGSSQALNFRFELYDWGQRLVDLNAAISFHEFKN